MIEKQGALNIDCVYKASERLMQIQGAKFFPDPKLALADTADADHGRANFYDGPDMQQYDEAALEKVGTLRFCCCCCCCCCCCWIDSSIIRYVVFSTPSWAQFYKYLEEHGVNDEFAGFLDAFATLKERRNYADWLKSVGKFLDA